METGESVSSEVAMKERKFFYCLHCFNRKPVAEIGQTLDNQSLCRQCVAAGFCLKRGVVVKRKL